MIESDQNSGKDSKLREYIKEIRGTLISRNEILGKMHAEIVASWMKFRRDIFLASISLLIVITPFAANYVKCPIVFYIGYILLFLSGIVGLVTEECRLSNLNNVHEHGSAQMKKAIEKLFERQTEENLKQSLNEFNAAKSPDHLERRMNTIERTSSIAFWSYIFSLILIVISILPFSPK